MERQALAELMQAKILRAAYSERQLEEVMVDFWFNHFNVFAGKGQVRVYLTEYERDAIRPHVLGNVPRSAAGHRREPGDAVLSRQLAERGARRCADVGGRDNGTDRVNPRNPNRCPARGPDVDRRANAIGHARSPTCRQDRRSVAAGSTRTTRAS